MLLATREHFVKWVRFWSASHFLMKSITTEVPYSNAVPNTPLLASQKLIEVPKKYVMLAFFHILRSRCISVYGWSVQESNFSHDGRIKTLCSHGQVFFFQKLLWNPFKTCWMVRDSSHWYPHFECLYVRGTHYLRHFQVENSVAIEDLLGIESSDCFEFKPQVMPYSCFCSSRKNLRNFLLVSEQSDNLAPR